ncbi:cation:proton antiporter [Pseudoblastomonas halimionae]|uniref:Sodium:proton antiporter n=1 Tax=Alteriqipengyuania halimionae TaxID=1926630 RepID=A0A6I4U7Q1_9SPHN|nr:sodium:proton antiporter [Alteriqipengyuania halimionae]MXP10267.1 sodium:proton antiporter [Alteriqipengyuania halimionae]
MHLDTLLVKIALIGVLGMIAQWVAWRTGRPAIVFLLLTGIVVGPVLGYLNPAEDFGELQEPIIKLAVAVILFEGGLSLRFRDLIQAAGAVKRLIFLGVPLGFTFCTLAVHYGVGLSWELSMLFGGILVVTGPTVIGPLLRELRVPRRTGDALKWEAIINDPIGALLAIGIFAYLTYEGIEIDPVNIGTDVLVATGIAALIGLACGWALTWLFPRGYVPEFLKAPVLLVTVIASFVAADLVMHESGLVTVTVMGMVMANKPTFSTQALRRFKEDLVVLLISGVFIIMSATLNWDVVSRVQWEFLVFLALLMFVARPATVLLALLFSDVPWRERLFIAWIAPRGIVAVAITGLFAIRLEQRGVEGAELLVPLAFATAIATIVAHGFTAKWWAHRLGIDQGRAEGLMLVGVNGFSLALAKALKAQDIKVEVVDSSKFALRAAKKLEVPTHHGDMLDDDWRHHLPLSSFRTVIAMTETDAFNALVCSELGPELGYDMVAQAGPDQRTGMTTARGNVIFQEKPSVYDLLVKVGEGWQFSRTRMTEQFRLKDLREYLGDEGMPFAVIRPDNSIELFTSVTQPTVGEGDVVMSFTAPATAEERKEKHEEKREQKDAKEREAKDKVR